MNNKDLKEGINTLLKRIAKDKKAVAVIALGVIGMLLVAFSDLDVSDSEKAEILESSVSFRTDEQKLELEKLLSEITGAGRVKVMITYECGYETVYAQDVTNQNDAQNSKTVSEYIIIDGGADEKGLIIKEVFPKVKGIAVVCDGGNEPTVKNEIISMLKALFDISSNSISVVPMET